VRATLTAGLSLGLFSLSACSLSLDFDGISDGKSRATVPPPIAYFRLDDASGAVTATDSIGDHEGSLVVVSGSPRFAEGRRGGALVFSEGRGALLVTRKASFPRRGSLAMWTHAAGLPEDRRLLFAARTSTSGRFLQLALERDRLVWISGAQGSYIDGVRPGRWVLVVALWDAERSVRALYVREDGGRSDYFQSSGVIDVDATATTIEVEHPSGAIDDVRLFDRMLTRAEMDAID
jgi:hypothetical protein